MYVSEPPAIQFTRENIAEVILYTENRAKNFRCASRMPYHKFHCNIGDRNCVEGDWILKDPETGDLTVLSDKKYKEKYASNDRT